MLTVTAAQIDVIDTDRDGHSGMNGASGVSQISADMRTLLERRAHDAAAGEAVELFFYQVKEYIGALAAVLGGLDTLVFTGGIGERAAPVRWEIAQGFAYLGVALDPERHDAEHQMEITSAGTTVALQKYQTVLVPAGAGRCSVRTDHTRAPFIFVTPPASPDALAARLLEVGIPQRRIDAFNEQFSGGAT